MKPFGCLSMAAELGRDIRGIYGVWSKPRISDVERLQVKEGSCTFSFQLIKVGSDVAERFNFGVILGRRELSPNSLPLLNLSTWLMANFLSEGMGLASKESIRHSGWEYHAPFLTKRVIASLIFFGWVLRILILVRTW